MNKCIFPVKLVGIINTLLESDVFKNKCKLPIKIDSLNDDKMRYVMLSPEIHDAVKHELKNESVMLRKRLAIPLNIEFLNLVKETVFEVYDDDKLIYSKQVTELEGQLALAVQVELLFDLCETKGFKITTM